MTHRNHAPAEVPAPLSPLFQILVLVAIAIALAFTPVGRFVRSLPYGQARDLIKLMRAGASRDDRLSARIGRDYGVVRSIRENTRPDAIILISDRFAKGSPLDAFAAKHQDWATYFLYPRRVLYLYQRTDSKYRDATWLLVDCEDAVSWMDPGIRPVYEPGEIEIVPFRMGRYLDGVRSGVISEEFLPPSPPARLRSDGERGE